MYSMSTQENNFILNKSRISKPKREPTFSELQMAAKQQAMNNAFFDSMGLFKSSNNKGGSVTPRLRGVYDPSHPDIKMAFNFRGIREKMFRVDYSILRSIAKRVGVIEAIHNTRKMQIKPFARISYNDDDVGFRCKLKDKDATPNGKDKKTMKEIESFFLHSGYTDLPDYFDREDKMLEMFQILTTDMLSIDQIAIELRRNRSGKIIDYYVLDAAMIKRTTGQKDRNGKKIKYCQEINNKILADFTDDEMVFYCTNRSSEIINRGYGYSLVEQCLDLITGWLYAMAFNKEYFNSNSMPRGFMTFEGGQLDQEDLEELQRQWISMFSGIKGMWKTPFLQYNAKYNPITQSNKDMMWDSYIQVLSSWICAIHGIDAAEMGLRLAQAQNVLNENQEAKIAYSKDRGLRDLVTFHETWMNKIIERVPEWNQYELVLTGVEAKDQQAELEIDKGQTEVYMTINEKRKEHDLKPIEGGDIIMNPTYIQSKAQDQMAQQQGGMGGEGEGENIGANFTPEQQNALQNASEEDMAAAVEGSMNKSMFDDNKDFIEIEL